MIWGNRVRERREKLSLTKRELADRIGVSTSTISKWENWESTPQSFNLQRLVRVLDTTEEYLMGLTDNPLSVHVSVANIRATAVEQPRPFVPIAVAEMPKANATRGKTKKSFYWGSMIFTAFIALFVYMMIDTDAERVARPPSYHAIDGNMIDAVKQGINSRYYILAGVLAPHVARTSDDIPSAPFGEAARDFIDEVIQSKDLYVEILRGDYAYVWLGTPNNSSDIETIKTQMLNALMISKGFSRHFYPLEYTIKPIYNTVFASLQKEAQDKRVGIWSLPENSPEARAKAEAERLEEARKAAGEEKRLQAEEEKERKKEQQEYLREANKVVVTPRGKKYHYDWCHTVKGSYRTLTIKQAKKRGYTACKVCSPPSQEVTLENSNIYWGNDVYRGER